MHALVVSHTGELGGAEHSLLRFLGALPPGIQATVACPDGPLAGALDSRGLARLPLRATTGSLRLHPIHTARAVGEMGLMALEVRRHSRRIGADLVHANSIRAGLVALGARAIGGPPVAVHVRDVLPPGPVSDAICGVLRSRARTVIAISRHVARAFGDDPRAPSARVVMELVDPRDFAPRDGAAARAALGLPADAQVLAIVAQITPWKGQDVAIRALARVLRSHPRAQLLIIGEAKFVARSTRFDNASFERSLHVLAAELGVAGAVHFLGARDDVARLMAATDVLLVPSHEEPFGLAVIEGMAMQRAVVATCVGGPAEVITDGVDGRLADPHDDVAWAAAITELLDDDAGRHALGVAARQRVLDAFTPERYGEAMAGAYAATARLAA